MFSTYQPGHGHVTALRVLPALGYHGILMANSPAQRLRPSGTADHICICGCNFTLSFTSEGF